jgi:hypothetical protein
MLSSSNLIHLTYTRDLSHCNVILSGALCHEESLIRLKDTKREERFFTPFGRSE